MINATRDIMTEGARVVDVIAQILVMVAMTVGFMALGAGGFKCE